MRYLIFVLFLLISGGAFAQEKLTVYFDFNEEAPNAGSAEAMQQWIAANGNAKIIAIHGFADAADNEDYNYKLSSKRIENIAGILKNSGLIFSEEAVMKPYGETEASGNSEEDRRVVVWYVLQAIEKQPPGFIQIPRKPLEAAMFTKGNKIVLDGLLFFPDTAEIIPESAAPLAELANIMINNPRLKIQLHGHMCCSAYDRTNLSGDRAKMVFKYLAAKGVKKNRMEHKGFGTTRPVHNIPEKNEGERLANRRVEIEVIED